MAFSILQILIGAMEEEQALELEGPCPHYNP